MAGMPKQVVGNAGLYFVCYELTKRGWNVLPTSRNARGVDIVIYDEDAKRKHTVQVKALSRRDPVPMGTSLDHLIADYFVVCTKVLGPTPEIYIIRGSEVAGLVHKGEKDGKVSYWLQPKSYEAHKNAWGLIGTCYGL